MNKSFIIISIFSLFFILNLYSVESCKGTIQNEVCCDPSCKICGLCTNDAISNSLCCISTILNSGICCQNNNSSACIINCNNSNYDYNRSTRNNEYDEISGWLDSLAVYELVLVIIGCCLVLIFLLYVCCCFGRHKPPVKYEEIVGICE